jgi:hypothetical protein
VGLDAGPGNDAIDVPGSAGYINCGPGNDIVTLHGFTRDAQCERDATAVILCCESSAACPVASVRQVRVGPAPRENPDPVSGYLPMLAAPPCGYELPASLNTMARPVG